MKETSSAGGIVMNASGEVAIVSHGPGDAFLGFPKGHIDAGEDALTAAKREITEETGISEITLVKDLGTYKRYKGTDGGGDDTTEMKTIYMFLFTTTETELAPQDPFNPEARWVPLKDVEKTLTHPKDKAFFLQVLPELEK